MEEKPKEDKYSSPTWKCFAIFLMVLSLAAVIAVIIVAVLPQRERVVQVVQECPKQDTTDYCPENLDQIDTSESEFPGVFHDLTHKETLAVKKYLFTDSGLNLAVPSIATTTDSYMFYVDLHLPPKKSVLDHLDKNGPQPDREALVVIFRGDKKPPVVEEYLVGPLPNPSYHKSVPGKNRTIPYYMRPPSVPEYNKIDEYIDNHVMPKLANVLKESFDAEYCYSRDNCIKYYNTYVNAGLIGKEERKMWMALMYEIPFFSVHPVGMNFLVNIGDSSNDDIAIESVEYGEQLFKSLDDFLNQYNMGNLTKIKLEFPKFSQNLFSTMYRRGQPVPEKPQRPPTFYEPDGKRYSIKNRHVKYMNWDFDVGMRAVSGLAAYDVRFKNERIAYEISLQEVAVLYSGGNAYHKSTDFLDASELLIRFGHSLIPGTDCPETSSYIDTVFYSDSDDDPAKLSRVVCIFEECTGFPLHRHFSYGDISEAFYGGMPDSAIVVRSVLAVWNYDYVIDMVFHQNGVVHIRSAATGYIFSSYYTNQEKDFAFRLHDYTAGNLHQHLLNYKIDLDIHGTKNRYETLNLKTQESPLDYSEGGNPNSRLKFSQHLKASESESAYKYIFQEPMYHLIHNNDQQTRFGDISGYRVHVSSMTHRLLPDDAGAENSMAWSRYQMAITKYKETERSSTSPYGSYDSMDPVVNFTSFVADNENIVDEDLVIWATVGNYHIPHMEDLPVTPTTGGMLNIYLLPYNYFTECPSMSSRDRVYLDLNKRYDPSKGIKIEAYGKTDKKCVPRSVDLRDFVDRPANEIFS